LEEREDALQSSPDEGIALRTLANSAADLFADQLTSEQGRLFYLVLPNSVWANVELVSECSQSN